MALLHNQPTTQGFLCVFFQFIIQLAWHDFDFATLGMHLVLFSLAGQERAWALLSFRKIWVCLVGGECWGGLCELGLMGKRVVCFLYFSRLWIAVEGGSPALLCLVVLGIVSSLAYGGDSLVGGWARGF